MLFRFPKLSPPNPQIIVIWMSTITPVFTTTPPRKSCRNDWKPQVLMNKDASYFKAYSNLAQANKDVNMSKIVINLQNLIVYQIRKLKSNNNAICKIQ